MLAFFVVFFAAAVHVARGADCFKFKGDISPVLSDTPTFTIGETISLEWEFDSAFCIDITALSKVKIELYEYDFWTFDDFITEMTTSITLSDSPFDYTIPYDLSVLLKGAGESEDGAEFYFRITSLDNAGMKGESKRFKISSAGSFINIEDLRGQSFATGSELRYDVFSKQLPSREIECRLMQTRIGFDTNRGPMVQYKTTSSTGTQKKVVSYRPGSELPSADKYYIVCETIDDAKPEISTTLSEDKWFRIETIELSIDVTNPEKDDKPKANSELLVEWETDGVGLIEGEKFEVRIFQLFFSTGFCLSLFCPPAGFNPVEVWSTASGTAAEPLVASKSFLLPIPPGLGPADLVSNLLDGRTDDYFVELRLKSNPDFRRRSPNFQIQQADRGCVLTKPVEDGVVRFGTNAEYSFDCSGYAIDDVSGRISLLTYKEFGGPPGEQFMDNGARALVSGSLSYQMIDSSVQGWIYRTQVSHASDPAQLSHVFLGARTGSDCQTDSTGHKVVCSASPLVATQEYAQRINSIDLLWAGPNCMAQTAQLTIAVSWSQGGSDAITTMTSARLIDRLNTTQKLFGQDCLDCLDVNFRFVEYPNDRKSLSFDMLLTQPTHPTAPLNLGQIQFTDVDGCDGQAVSVNVMPPSLTQPVLNTNQAITFGGDQNGGNGTPSDTSAQNALSLIVLLIAVFLIQ